MPERAATICRQPGCGVTGHGEYCTKHVLNNNRIEYERDRQNDAVARWYHTARWKKFSLAVRVRNAQCQRIIDGVQCMNGGTDVHHLISPRVDPSKFLDPSNVINLCAGCHPASKLGTPEWVADRDFVPTVFTFSI